MRQPDYNFIESIFNHIKMYFKSVNKLNKEELIKKEKHSIKISSYEALKKFLNK